MSYLFETAGRMASNLSLETALSGTCTRRPDVQPRQLAQRRVQTITLERFLVPPLEGASSGSHGRGRLFHPTALLLDTTGFVVGGISTKVIQYWTLQGQFKTHLLDSVSLETCDWVH
jgi:hypothetical protein